MKTSLYIFPLIILLNVITIYIFYPIAFKLGLVDSPGKRKMHQGDIPVIGGICFYMTMFLLIYIMNLPQWILVIIYSSSVIVILGAIDDSLQLGVLIRLISQLIASLIVIGSGLQIVDIGEYSTISAINLGQFGILLTIISVLGLINAFNFIDGIDGLSSGLFAIAIFSLLFFSLLTENLDNFDFLICLIILIFIFIFFNLGIIKNKKIFLGDSGSTLLGFIIAWLLIYYAHPSVRNIHPILTIWCVTLPVFDLLTVVIRRILKGINPLRPDRRHIHHMFLRKGYSQIKTLTLILLFSSFASIFGVFIFIFFGPFPSLLAYIILFFLYFYFSIYFFQNRYKLSNISE